METRTDNNEFNEVVDFHGCYCLDIAMGYRVAKALVREMGDDMNDMKAIFAQTGTSTCAIDAIQKITGCTLGKRNLIMTDTGKPTYALQNTKSGRVVRAYCHYWDHFDHSELRKRRKAAKGVDAPAGAKAAFDELLDKQVEEILKLPEASMFKISEVKLEAPPKSSKYISEACGVCGEYANKDYLIDKNGMLTCKECA